MLLAELIINFCIRISGDPLCYDDVDFLLLDGPSVNYITEDSLRISWHFLMYLGNYL